VSFGSTNVRQGDVQTFFQPSDVCSNKLTDSVPLERRRISTASGPL
jgi:hypothetical protein